MDMPRVIAADEPAGPSSLHLESAVLARLMDEVRNNSDRQPSAYNRMHNRHNR